MSKKTQQEIAAPDTTSDVEAVAEQQKNEESKKRSAKKAPFFTSKRITQYAVFLALALVMKMVGKSLTLSPSFTVTFIYIPWILSGAVLGPVGGMIVGALSDVLGNFIFSAQFIPLTFVSNMLYPLPAAVIYKVWKRGNHYAKLSVSAVCSLFLCTLGVGSLSLYTWYGYFHTMNFFRYLLLFRMPQVGVFAVNLVVLVMLVAPLVNVGILPETAKTKRSDMLKTALFTLGVCALTALLIAALIVIGSTKPALINKGMTEVAVGGTVAIIVLVYGVLTCLTALTVAKKDSTASVALKASIIILLYAALAISTVTYKSSINLLYMFLIAVAILAVVVLIRFIGRKKGVKRK